MDRNFSERLDLFNPVTKTFTNYRDRSPNNLLYHIHDIKEYRPGELFISSDNGMGIFKADKGEIIQSDNPNLKIRTEPISLYIPSIWIRKKASGWAPISMESNSIRHFRIISNIIAVHHRPRHNQEKVINVIKEDKDDKYWIGTDDNGIFRFDAKTQEITLSGMQLV